MAFKKVFLSMLLLLATLSNSKAQTALETMGKKDLKITEYVVSKLSNQELENLVEYIENNEILLDTFSELFQTEARFSPTSQLAITIVGCTAAAVSTAMAAATLFLITKFIKNQNERNSQSYESINV